MMACQHVLLKKAANQEEAFLAGYFVGADPSFHESINIIKEAVKAGLDAVEIGIPSANPFLEGDVIRRAHVRTRGHFHNNDIFLQFLTALRQEIEVPIWIMGYSAEIVSSNLYKQIVEKNVADAFIIPNITHEELTTMRYTLRSTDAKMIPVINNHMSDEEILFSIQDCDIIYCQLYSGKTGSEIKNFDSLPAFEQKMRTLTNAALVAGFGIKTPNVVREVISCGFDGVVVGSEIVRLMEEETTFKLTNFIQDLKKAIRKEGNGV